MPFKFLKSPLEQAEIDYKAAYDKGLNLGKYDVAQERFSDAAREYSEGGDQLRAFLANSLASFMGCLCSPHNPRLWRDAARNLQSLGEIDVFVPTAAKASILSKECIFVASEIEANNVLDMNRKAQMLEDVAKNYLSLGNTKLTVLALIERQDFTGIIKANILAATADKMRGDTVVDMDPKKAAEYYQKSALRLKTIGESKGFSEYDKKARLTSEPAKCWFCGREVYGRDVHFVPMKSVITPYQQQHMGKSVLPSIHQPDKVLACKACHSAITTAADEIAKGYYSILKIELSELRSYIEREISRLRGEIALSRR